MKWLFAWVGFPSAHSPHNRAPRQAGRTKWNYWKLWNFAVEGITSFTVPPLKFATYLGRAIALLAGLYLAQPPFRALIFGNPVADYPSLLAVILFMGGAQFVILEVMGKYLVHIFTDTKHRPLYFVEAREIPRSGGAITPPISQPDHAEESAFAEH
jgi:hypothetical protein